MGRVDKKLVTIVGPTASGKTGLAVFLARKFDGEIVSADSRQVYRGLDIGTGKDLAEYGNIKYHLINIVEPGTPFTMFDWLKEARIVIEDIFSRGRIPIPIIVGGTGLYIQALLEGFQLQPENFQFPKSKFQINSKIQIPKYKREELNKMPLSELQSLAKKLEARSSKLEAIDTNNPRRLVRFIERAQFCERMTKRKPDFNALQIGIDLPREELYKKIDRRADQWFCDGILEEVEGLLANGVNPEWLIKLGLEYRIIMEYILKNPNYKIQMSNKIQITKSKKLNQATSYKLFSDMKQRLKFAIHAYARRQLTWFRRFPEIKWVESKEEALEIAEEFMV